MSGLNGTRWVRNGDGIEIEIIADSDRASGRGNRSLLAVNMSTGRRFWVTPEGLSRKYRPKGTISAGG